MVEQHDFGVVRLGDITDFFRLAAANEIAWIGPIASTGNLRDRNGARRACQLAELEDVFGIRGRA